MMVASQRVVLGSLGLLVIVAIGCGGGTDGPSVATASGASSAAGGRGHGGASTDTHGGGGTGGAGGAAASGGNGGGNGPASCAGTYSPPTEIPVAEPALLEASGIVSSRRNPGVLWLHNDSGDTARLFAVGVDGAALGVLDLPGVEAHDFEDIAAAPCPDGSGPCLWVADLGNNDLKRDDLALLAVAEPAVDAKVPFGAATASKVWRFPVAYPKGVAINAEAIVVAPDGSAVWAFEKVDAPTARIFGAKTPLSESTPTVLEQVGSVLAPGVAVKNGVMITGADLHPSGGRLLVRVYTGVYEYRLAPGQWPAHLDQAERVTIALGPLSEKQGEAIAYDEAGTGVWTISEDPSLKATQPLHHYACAAP